MFLSFYGFREQPFGVTPDPSFLYETPVHREALASLVYGIESGSGFTALIAAPGMGKTTLLFHLLERYRLTARSAFLFDTQCDSHELLQSLLADLELDTRGNDAEMLARFKELLTAQAQAGKRVLLLIDEAQNLAPKVLETLRLLSNFETPREKLVHIILSGQPQLAEIVSRPEMLQLRQRITLFTRLSALTPQETVQYVNHRLNRAGCGRNLPFTPDALRIIAAESQGIPREINRICFNALSLGCALQKRTIGAELLHEVMKDLRITEFPALRVRPTTSTPGFKEEYASSTNQGHGAITSERTSLEEPAIIGAEAATPPAVQHVAAGHAEICNLPLEFHTITDPFAPRPRPAAALRAQPGSTATSSGNPSVVAASDRSTPISPLQIEDLASVSNTKTRPQSDQPEVRPPAPKSEVGEVLPAGDDKLAMQRALLDVALKSQKSTSHMSLAGVALIIPLLLWIVAYLIFRLDLVSLLSH